MLVKLLYARGQARTFLYGQKKCLNFWKTEEEVYKGGEKENHEKASGELSGRSIVVVRGTAWYTLWVWMGGVVFGGDYIGGQWKIAESLHAHIALGMSNVGKKYFARLGLYRSIYRGTVWLKYSSSIAQGPREDHEVTSIFFKKNIVCFVLQSLVSISKEKWNSIIRPVQSCY
ncbi:hypothetical protein ACJX0J_036430, partial [Zea mays]